MLAESPDFSIFSKGGMEQVRSAQDALALRMSHPQKPMRFVSLASAGMDLIPVDHFALQLLLKSKGIPQRALINIIGRESTGKTTFAYYLAGCAMRHRNARVLMLHWVAKPYYPDRAARSFSSNPEHARAMVAASTLCYISSFREMLDAMDLFVKQHRKELPLEIPLFVVVDNWSKMLADAEAQGRVDYGKFTAAEGSGDDKKSKAPKIKEVATGSNLGHAQFASDWTRVLGHWQTKYNVTVVTINDQTEKISMQKILPGRPNPEAMKSDLTKDLTNNTHRGGRSIHQNANLELIFAPGGNLKGAANAARGKIIWVRNHKSDFSGDGFAIDFELRRDHAAFDRPGYIDPVWHMDETLVEYFLENKYFGLTVSRGLYTSHALGVHGGSALDVSLAFHSNPEHMQTVGRDLQLLGYGSYVEDAPPLQVSAETVEAWDKEDRHEGEYDADELPA